MTIWRRHTGDSKFHTGSENSVSFVTLCNGRWSLEDEVAGDVVYDVNPPHDERCEACQRVRIELRRVERGLSELGEATAQDWPGVHELFDLGGEG